VNSRKPYPLVALNIEVDNDGTTRLIQGGKPNAQVALDVNVAAFMNDFVTLLVH
jgi:hypothetical protein